MENFNEIYFRGKFRNYQQRVLNNCKKYNRNNKIHIVAAPGSGKTILGLELICRLGEPTLILSPTNTIKYQWGERFEEFFIDKIKNQSNYVSYDLNDVKLITSITYQALHSAIKKECYLDEDNNMNNYSNVDVFKLINDYGIKTICVDEAHHLQNEWQKSLETFIKKLNKDIKIIALTATPPYDASPIEWKRYIDICGKIDEEIFVTELVKEKNLCPHQDYIYFNYPTKEEAADFEEYNKNAVNALKEISCLDCIKILCVNADNILKNNVSNLLDDYSNVKHLILLLKNFGAQINKKTIAKYSRQVTLGKLTIEKAEIAIQCLLRYNCLLKEKDSLQIKIILKKYGLLNKGRVCLNLNYKLKNKLITSIGKLNSINNIVAAEDQNMGKNLRMLILTDYIKKVSINIIGTKQKITNIGVSTIFETIRRENDIKIGALSGELIILPTELKSEIIKNINTSKLTTKNLANTNYSVFQFKATNKEKVKIVGDLFSKGLINVLIGTKALLGEGWDSPCINSLILASFVGSFMLSNQMRGRAIRIDKNNPNKTANIWHLVTLEPKYNENSYISSSSLNESADYATLKRRFNCFVAPSYSNKSICNGIERIGCIKNELSASDVDKINKEMVLRSQNRNAIFNAWGISGCDEMCVETLIPIKVKCISLRLKYTFKLILSLMGLIAGVSLFAIAISNKVNNGIWCLIFILGLSLTSLSIFFIYKNLIRTYLNLTNKNTIRALAKAVLNTMDADIDLPNNSKLIVKKQVDNYVVKLKNVSIKQQNDFSNALIELFSKNIDLRYMVISKSIFGYNYKYSLFCPRLFGKNKENAKKLGKNLGRILGNVCVIYITNNKELVLNCIQKSCLLVEKDEIKINIHA